ncbi:MAG: hypothetical protein ACXQTP_05005 [Candidatus Methanofastidiosia archaeon]
MNKKNIVLAFLLLLVVPLFSGCMGGDSNEEEESTPYEGTLEELMLTTEDIPAGYELVEKTDVTDSMEIFEEEDTPVKLGFKEAYTAMYTALGDDLSFSLLMEMAIRFDIAKMDEVLSEFKREQEEDYGDEIELVDFGKIGDETYGMKFYDEEAELTMYQIAFTKKDIMILLIIAGGDDTENTIKNLAKTVEARI